MSSADTCPRCGNPLSLEAPQGLCPECLLKVGMESHTAEPAGTPSWEMPTESQARGASAPPKSSPGSVAELPQVGLQFGPYQLIRQLGKGGMGAVYEADDLETGRRVALKLLAHSLESTQARNRFFREGRLAASINHPNSVYVYGTGEIDGTPVISMEHISGGTLSQRVKKEGPLPVTAAVDVVLQIIEGLDAAAKVGVLHRDVKPSNCFIDSEGTVKVGDFGLSISTSARGDTHLTQAGSFLGTPAFCSPEQLRGDDLDVRSDIYAVGVTLFYVLTGRTPYEAENLVNLLATVLEQPPPSPSQFRGEIPQGLAKVILRCLAKQPSDRYKNYAELREALVLYNSTAPTPATLARRFVAGAIDQCLWGFTVFLVQLAWSGDLSAITDPNWFQSPEYIAILLVALGLQLSYFAIPEGLWGASLGKVLCQLRVLDRDRSLIGIPRAALRAAIWIALPSLPFWIYFLLTGHVPFDVSDRGIGWTGHAVGYAYYAILALMFSTARRHNGYSAWHDLAVGARVIQRPVYVPRPSLETASPTLPDTTGQVTIGPYHVLDTLSHTDSGEFILGYDTRLLRRVWIYKLSPGTPPVTIAHRNISRVGRLRWINGRRDDAECWDAYEALSGKPLFELIREPQPWSAVRYWVSDLAEELRAAEHDGTLPETLALDRVWITAEGRAKLLDFAAPGSDVSAREKQETLNGSKDPAAQRFLLRVAASALRGRIIDDQEKSLGSAASRLPVEAHTSLRQLPKTKLTEFCSRMKQLVRRTPKVTRTRRVAMLAATAAMPLFFAGIMCLGLIWSNRWTKQQPEIWDLRDCLVSLDAGLDKRVAGAKNQQERDEVEAQREALEIYVVGSYRDVVSDAENWNSLFVRSSIPPPLRRRAERMMNRPVPTAQEFEQAKTLIQPILEEHQSLQEIASVILSPPRMALFQFAGIWFLLVAIPGLVASLIFRRGLILRMFGVECVNRAGAPASRLRLLWRWLLFNLPILCLPIIVALMRFWPPATMMALVVTGLAALACWSCLIPQRGLPDRMSGTYLVPL